LRYLWPVSRLLFIIPAKGNSKSVPSKNLQLVGGESLLRKTLRLAEQSITVLDASILVSTDSKEIFNEVTEITKCVSKEQKKFFDEQTIGSINHFTQNILIHKRPIGLSTLTSRTTALIRNLLVNEAIKDYEHFILLQPTSPFRSLTELLNITKLYFASKTGSLVSVKKFESPHPEKRIKLSQDNKLDLIDTFVEKLSSPRQELGEYWSLDGAYYLFSREKFQSNYSLIQHDTFFYRRKGLKTINIDTVEDLLFAQFIAEKRMENVE